VARVDLDPGAVFQVSRRPESLVPLSTYRQHYSESLA
jgi:hypothetical protein